MKIIAIDPGQNGGLVSLYIDAQDFSVVGEYLPMPDTEHAVAAWLRPFGDNHFCTAVIEKVHSMPKQGVASTFTFGVGYGFLRGCLVTNGIRFYEVTPRAWQKSLGIPPRAKDETQPQFKLRLLAKAQQLFPSLAIWSEPRSKTRQLAIADALLIAEYGRITYR